MCVTYELEEEIKNVLKSNSLFKDLPQTLRKSEHNREDSH